MNKTPLFAMLAIGMLSLAGAAAATGTSLAGYGYVEADATAYGHVDHQAVVDDANKIKDRVMAEVEGQLGAVKEQTTMSANAGISASADAKEGLLAGLQANIAAFADWIQSLWVKPHMDVSSSTISDTAGAAQGGFAESESGLGGTLDLSAASDLESTARADYNLPPPPKPDAGFLGAMKAAFEAFFQIG